MLTSLILAADEANGIGKNNQLLCHLSADLQYFKRTTSGHHIVMGRKTYESIGKPLPNRVNLVVSRNAALEIPGCVVCGSLEQAEAIARQAGENELFITGGSEIFKLALPHADKVYLTRIHATFEADTFFVSLPDSEWELISSERHTADDKNAVDYSFMVYKRK